jgi:hypothetical protein
MDIISKLRLIQEGYSIEEIIIKESAEVVEFAILASAMTAIGIGAYIKGIKNRKELERKKKQKELEDSIEQSQRKIQAEEYLKHTSQETLITNIKSDIKKIVQEFKTDPKVTTKIKKSLKADIEKGDSADYRLVYDDQGDYIEIIDGDQSVKISLHWIISDIENAIEIKYKKEISLRLVSISTGDGDEGCIYVD